MKRASPLVAVLAIWTACDAPTPAEPDASLRPAMAAVATTSNAFVPIALAVFVPCANGGAGETVTLTGNLHFQSHTTVDAQGGLHANVHTQPQGVSGTGDVTGAKYQGTGVTQDRINVTAGETFTFVNNFRIIGQGPGNNFLVHQNVHITINANGDLTADVDNLRAECK
jgi:hypothetical protein